MDVIPEQAHADSQVPADFTGPVNWDTMFCRNGILDDEVRKVAAELAEKMMKLVEIEERAQVRKNWPSAHSAFGSLVIIFLELKSLLEKTASESAWTGEHLKFLYSESRAHQKLQKESNVDTIVKICLDILPKPGGESMNSTRAAEIIKETVAALPKEERQEVQVEALVKSVDAKTPYQEQIKEFTEITHTMRVRMAGQLEPRFREHLKDDAPPAQGRSPAIVAKEKREFAREKTDELSRLGLGIKWGKSNQTCYLGSAATKQNAFGVYLLFPHASQPIKTVAGWSESQLIRRHAQVDSYVRQIRLTDAAPPRGKNCLSPKSI